jgi:hypothetical protein
LWCAFWQLIKRCGFLTNGYLRVSFAGGSHFHPQDRLLKNWKLHEDENTVFFRAAQERDFEELKAAAEKLMSDAHRPKRESGGDVDELERLARLLEKGHITREEFNRKKRQILG